MSPKRPSHLCAASLLLFSAGWLYVAIRALYPPLAAAGGISKHGTSLAPLITIPILCIQRLSRAGTSLALYRTNRSVSSCIRRKTVDFCCHFARLRQPRLHVSDRENFARAHSLAVSFHSLVKQGLQDLRGRDVDALANKMVHVCNFDESKQTHANATFSFCFKSEVSISSANFLLWHLCNNYNAIAHLQQPQRNTTFALRLLFALMF